MKPLLRFGSVLAVLLSAISAIRAADTLPSQISDKDFWAMVTTMSETGGSFPFVSNVEVYIQNGTAWTDFYANLAMLPLDSSSTFIRFVDLNNTRYLNPPGLAWVSKISPMLELVNKFKADSLPSYHEVLGALK
jgi:hypothetical protein